jgi:hypothetical protein
MNIQIAPCIGKVIKEREREAEYNPGSKKTNRGGMEKKMFTE